jgi:hypothetical protein
MASADARFDKNDYEEVQVEAEDALRLSRVSPPEDE